MLDKPRGPTVFLSYRRQDTKHIAGRLNDRLRSRFGDDMVFMDVGSIQPGLDFRDAIAAAIDTSDVVLVLIGTGWLKAVDSSGQPRLDDPADPVALEVQTALNCTKRVIPVLVDGAPMPAVEQVPPRLGGLAHRNAVPLDHQTFDVDCEALLNIINIDASATTRSAVELAERARSSLDEGKTELALFLAERGRAHDPDDAVCHCTIGLANILLGNRTDGRKSVQLQGKGKITTCSGVSLQVTG